MARIINPDSHSLVASLVDTRLARSRTYAIPSDPIAARVPSELSDAHLFRRSKAFLRLSDAWSVFVV